MLSRPLPLDIAKLFYLVNHFSKIARTFLGVVLLLSLAGVRKNYSTLPQGNFPTMWGNSPSLS